MASKKPLKHMLIKDVPTDLRLRFKAKCSRKNISMRQAFIKFMQETVSRKPNTNSGCPV